MLVVGVNSTRQERSSVSVVPADDRPGETGSPCDTPMCKVASRLESARSWDGWGQAMQVLPFLATTTVTTTTTVTATTTSTRTSTSTTVTKTSTTTTTSPSCAVVEEDDACHKQVLRVMREIRDDPDSRKGLGVWSSFEEVQTWLHRHEKKSRCWKACECQIAPAQSHCHASVMFAMQSGVREHPEWYKGLTEESSFNDFQEYLWRWVNDTECVMPCKAIPRADPSLFCWSVAREWGYEADVMNAQLTSGAGVFGCDGFAVVSENKWNLGTGPGARIGEVRAVVFEGANVGVSKDGTAANAELFMSAWDAVMEQTQALTFDWIVKVDPDAVVIADRLREHLRERSGWKVFVRNCNKLPQNPDFPMMFGSLEAISREGLQVYKDQGHRCKSELNWYPWGEDFFLGKCLPYLGVDPVDDFSIISDGVCTGVNCQDGWSAAFHPFKGADEWMNCWRQATGSSRGVPPPLP